MLFYIKMLPTDFTSEPNAIYAKALKEKEAISYTGFIAQEVEEAARKTEYNFSGVHKPTNEKDNYALSYAEFVVPLVKAVQEQQQMIDLLQKQVEAARAEIPMQIGKQQVTIEELKKQNELLLKRLEILENKNK